MPTLPPVSVLKLPASMRSVVAAMAVKAEPQADGSVLYTRLPDLAKVRVVYAEV